MLITAVLRSISFAIIAGVLAAGCKSGGEVDPQLASRAGVDPDEIPPSVLLGRVRLDCTIDWKQNGRQLLSLVEGAGLMFDATVSPIVDGTATLKGEKQGGEYRFTSH